MQFKTVKQSLTDLLGKEYTDAVCRAQGFLGGDAALRAARALCEEAVEFWPEGIQQRFHELLPKVGTRVTDPLQPTPEGAGTAAFNAASRPDIAPLSGAGCLRVAENGRLHLTLKSEHYHLLLGHAFPGYRLIENAHRLGIPNATHNNTRGFIVRLLEERLIRLANGLGDREPISGLQPDRVSRVLNIQTGSLAAEAALKLVLNRFYAAEEGDCRPQHAGRIPVVLVTGSDSGGLQGNYHGTCILPQMMRGMWPALRRKTETDTLRVVALRPNSMEDLEAAFRQYERAPFKIAGFFHEMVMMNYGALVMETGFLERAYELCREHDVPTVADEIQSCLWYPEGFLFRRYGLHPSIVVMGKGFSGGEYAAARLLLTEEIDTLPQFGALVTNGQEELASLAYLISMEWTRRNGPAIDTLGRMVKESLDSLARRFPEVLAGASGCGHLAGLRFRDLETGKRFANAMVRRGFDISIQSYKAECPPVALTKLPVIADEPVIECVSDAMREILKELT